MLRLWNESKMKLRVSEHVCVHIDSNAVSILLFKVSHAGSSPDTQIHDKLLAREAELKA